MQRKHLLKIPLIKRLYPSILRRLLKALRLNRRLWNIQGFKMCLDFLDSVDREIILKNEYEPEQINYFIAILKKNNISQIVDVGSNCGYFSFYIANAIHNIKIFSFEPIGNVYERFNETIVASEKKIRERIAHYNFGLSDKASVVAMALPKKNNFIGTGGARFVEPSYKPTKEESIKKVEFRKGDETLKSNGEIWGLKIDVEGHEINTLRGMVKFITSNKVFMQIEIFDDKFDHVNQFLIDNKFVMVNKIDDSSKTDYYYSNFKIS